MNCWVVPPGVSTSRVAQPTSSLMFFCIYVRRQLAAGFRYLQVPSAVLARSGAGAEVSEVRDAMSIASTRKGTKGAAATAGPNRGGDLAGDAPQGARGGRGSASPRGGGSASPIRGGRKGTRGSGSGVEVGDSAGIIEREACCWGLSRVDAGVGWF